MLLAPKYYPEAERHARNQDCPDCWESGTLDYVAADDSVTDFSKERRSLYVL